MPGTSRGERLERVRDELALVLADGVHAEVAQVVGRDARGRWRRRRPACPASNFQGISLNSDRRRWTSRIMSPPARNGGIASSSSRRAHSAPGAHRAEHLVAAERVEVGAELLDVDRHVRHGLGAVDEHERAGRVGHLDHLADRVDRARACSMTWVKATSFGLSRSRTSKTSRRRIPSSVIGMNSRSPSISWTRICHGTRLAWCSISVRTICVAAPDVPAAPRVGDEVDRLGRVAGEDDLVAVGRVDEPRDPGAGLLVGGRRLLADRVDAAMDVGVVLAVVVGDRVDDDARLLAASTPSRGRRADGR